MKNKKGFTLIEILVVVLIIGILAAIAVPQYQKAVQLSRVKTALPILRSIYDAKEIYYLSHGHYTGDLDELDIKVDNSGKDEENHYITSFGKVVLSSNSPYVYAEVDGGAFIDFMGLTEDNNGKFYGLCYNNNDICSHFGGRIRTAASSHWSGTNVYYVDNW